MREPTVARNYAEALFAAGERAGDTERYADLLEGIAGAIAAEPAIRLMLASPRVPKGAKQEVLARALEGHAPATFVKFLAAVIKRGRQMLLPAISGAYGILVDQKLNRVHAGVTLVREPDPALRDEVRRRLSAAMGKEVLPHFRADPAILGGVVVRVADRVMDGSLRRKMAVLRRKMLRG